MDCIVYKKTVYKKTIILTIREEERNPKITRRRDSIEWKVEVRKTAGPMVTGSVVNGPVLDVKKPPQWWGGAIIAMNYNEPVTESDSLRCSSRCNSIKVFFSGLLVARRNSRESGSSSSGKRGGEPNTEAAAYMNHLCTRAKCSEQWTHAEREDFRSSNETTANVTRFLVLFSR